MAGGFSKARLKRLSAGMRALVDQGKVGGLVYALSRRDQLQVEAFGSLDLPGQEGASRPVSRDSLFRIASMTKPVTAVAAMLLVEQGRLKLDQPIDRLLPELQDQRVLRDVGGPLADTVPARRPPTLRDLLTFLWGLGMILPFGVSRPIQIALKESGVDVGAFGPDLEPDEVVRRFAGLPLAHQPGEHWLYHSAYDVLAVLIARATGQDFGGFLQDHLFGPLGMRDTGFAVPKAELPRLAAPLRYDYANGRQLPFEDQRHSVKPTGSTGLVSTADDYLAFGRMMLRWGRHGAERILARPTVELMVTDHLTQALKDVSHFAPGFWDHQGFGFGMAVQTRRRDPYFQPGTYGWDGGLGTAWRSDPTEDLVGVLLTNRAMDGPGSSLFGEFWTLAYQAIDD
jgi:CubicO group peptidase (beta-lactamase class C family)